MVRKILLSLGVLLAIAIAYVAFTLFTTKSHSPADVASIENSDLSISVNYCRPYKKGRLLFGEEVSTALQKYGENWRTGANEATEITISKDLVFPEGILKAGSYSLYSIPGETEWVVAFNSKLNYWGADISGDPFDSELDVLRVTVPREKNSEEVEQFTIDFTKTDGRVEMQLLWGTVKVAIPIKSA